MSMTLSYTTYYKVSDERYNKWLDNFCRGLTEIPSEETIWDDFEDFVMSGCPAECEDLGNEDERDTVLYDVRERIAPKEVKQAKTRRAEIEKEITAKYAEVKRLREEMEQLIDKHSLD